jgi:hypothetical protein
VRVWPLPWGGAIFSRRIRTYDSHRLRSIFNAFSITYWTVSDAKASLKASARIPGLIAIRIQRYDGGFGRGYSGCLAFFHLPPGSAASDLAPLTSSDRSA